ncbi:MAG: hypothetical protein M1829_002154 [Trizodia sp. TS-e1964]|nr:MAG: hypothetical protein M1829_002154 [Trizodia sp. TS-e1964]
MTYATSSPSATTGQGNTSFFDKHNMSLITDSKPPPIQPICQNCTTSTTPLWRRDEIGSVLCNACGLFLKLHGRPRPISLKTDVIKSRNRVKSSGQAHKKKNLYDSAALSDTRSQAGTPPPTALGHRRTSQKSSTSNGSNSPISRTATPSYAQHLSPQDVFDGVALSEHRFTHSPILPALHLRHPSPGSASSVNGDRHPEPPHSYDSVFAANTTLKTRVSELEVINDLFRGRVSELEHEARKTESMGRENDKLRLALEESHSRESSLKRQLDGLEREIATLRDPEHRGKRMRLSDVVDGDAPSPATKSP